jgi:3-oxoacyl-[acyl-carrier protein] reductase
MVSKAGVCAFTAIAGYELSEYKINVNAVAPGTILTGMTKDYDLIPGLKEAYARETPIGRLGEPDDIAATVLFLSSNDSDYICGQTIYVCGGSTLRGANIYDFAKLLKEKSKTREKERNIS